MVADRPGTNSQQGVCKITLSAEGRGGEMSEKELKQGDYVLATKWGDGDPQDHWCIGFYSETLNSYGQNRFIVVDENGRPFRANGFRRAKRISKQRGRWILARKEQIEQSSRSLWYWARCSMKE